MSKQHNGGPAFPAAAICETHQINREGMTLRDYFAAKAMQIYLQEQRRDRREIEGGISPFSDTYSDQDVAELAYVMAEDMLKARNP